MKISLIQEEIEAALKDYLAGMGINISNKEIDIDFTAKRSGEGVSADIGIKPRHSKITPVVETDPTVPEITDNTKIFENP